MKSDHDKRYEIARKRVKEKKEFYKHLTTYLTMCIFFIGLAFFTKSGGRWVMFPILGWGIGILSHYFKAFGLPGVGPESDWEERAMEEELRRLGVPPSPQEKPNPETPPQEETMTPLELKELEKKYDDRDLV